MWTLTECVLHFWKLGHTLHIYYSKFDFYLWQMSLRWNWFENNFRIHNFQEETCDSMYMAHGSVHGKYFSFPKKTLHCTLFRQSGIIIPWQISFYASIRYMCVWMCMRFSSRRRKRWWREKKWNHFICIAFEQFITSFYHDSWANDIFSIIFVHNIYISVWMDVVNERVWMVFSCAYTHILKSNVFSCDINRKIEHILQFFKMVNPLCV